MRQKSSEPAEDFFKRFKVVLNTTGYKKDDIFVLDCLETAVSVKIIDQIYSCNACPLTTFQDWKETIISVDEMWRQWNAQKQAAGLNNSGNWQRSQSDTLAAAPAKSTAPTADQCDGTGFTYGGAGCPMEVDCTKHNFNCYNCGKPGHYCAKEVNQSPKH